MAHRTFDPVGAFQGARRGAVLIKAAEQDVARERAAAPTRNQLAEFKLGQLQVGAQRAETKFGQQQALQRMTIFGQSASALRGLPFEQRDAAFTAIEPELEKFGIPAGTFPPGEFTDENLDRAIAQAQAFVADPVTKMTEFETLKAGLSEEEAQRATRIKLGLLPKATAPTGAAPSAPAIIPQELLTGLDPVVASKGSAAFTAAGGGKDGLTAFQKIVDQGTEQQRRTASPQILKSSFPKASEAESIQLQAVMDAAKTTESGLQAAQKVRTDQIRLKKGKEFQNRAIELLKGILENPELNDVLGGIEGTGEGFLFGKQILSDNEADAVSDIEEATSILTSGNLDLLSGVLSDTDIQLLKDLSSGALKRVRSEKRFRADVQKLITKLSSKLVVTADDTAQDRAGANQQASPTSPQSGRQGGQLMTDAQGNRAFVFPDGTFEEVQ